MIFDDVASFTASEVFRDLHDELILVKGSRGMRLERILRYFDINDLRL